MVYVLYDMEEANAGNPIYGVYTTLARAQAERIKLTAKYLADILVVDPKESGIDPSDEYEINKVRKEIEDTIGIAIIKEDESCV